MPLISYRGVEQLVARRAHNPEVAGSSPVSATKSVTVVDTISATVIFYFLLFCRRFLSENGGFSEHFCRGTDRDVLFTAAGCSQSTAWENCNRYKNTNDKLLFFILTKESRPQPGTTPVMDGFPLSPRDIEDRKDKIEQTRSSRFFFCRPGPVFHCFHSLAVIFFPYRNRERCSSTRWGLPAVCTLFLKISIPYGADKQ